MGHRTCKRVPLDFDAPLKEVWQGYVTPERYRFPKCEPCDGTGYSVEAKAIADTFYSHSIAWPGDDVERLAWHDKLGQAEVDNLVAEGRLRVLKDREPTEDNPRNWEWVSVPRSAEEVNAQNRRGAGFGNAHDGINRWILIDFRCKVLGIERNCPTCQGHGNIATDELRDEAEAWEWTEPPVGEGWQLWETTSEGSPVSPVFATAQELADWCEPNATWFASERMSSADWLRGFVNDTTDVDSLLVLSVPRSES